MFHQRVLPNTAALFAEPELLAAYRDSLARQKRGPHLSLAVLADYISAEQKLGRIEAKVDCKLAAYLLMAASFLRAFLEHFLGTAVGPSWNKFVKGVIDAVVPLPERVDMGSK